MPVMTPFSPFRAGGRGPINSSSIAKSRILLSNPSFVHAQSHQSLHVPLPPPPPPRRLLLPLSLSPLSLSAPNLWASHSDSASNDRAQGAQALAGPPAPSLEE